MAVKPISPSDVKLEKGFPDEVIEAFNYFIERFMRNGLAKFKLKDIIAEIAYRMGIKREEVTKNKWCDVEDLYRQAGWKVVYDQPGWNESGEAYFEFRRK